MIVVTVNGKERELGAPTNLVSYLEQLGVAEQRLAVAYNGVVLRKQELAGVTLSQGDQLEIVRAVGGG
ncbi:MAG: sulfur carrier protein ThiS [Chloroflexi bacterium]|nr:sulfur carrier protein ThiS [Chloroflexota bacterium]